VLEPGLTYRKQDAIAMIMSRASLRILRPTPARRRRWTLLAVVILSQGMCAGSALADASPTVTSASPANGSVVGGETITLTGSDFLGPNGSCAGQYQIAFGFDLVDRYAIAPPSYTVLSDSQIRVVVPPSFGGPVDVRVHDSCGWSPIAGGDTFTYDYPTDQCLSGTCSVSIGSTAQAPLEHVGVGFLDGFNTDSGLAITPDEAQLVEALHPRQWRLGQAWLTAPGGGVFTLARQSGAKISVDLTSDWLDWAYNQDQANYTTPYNDLSTYFKFIYNDVRQRMAANEVPDYFDVWNEPSTRGTVNQWLSVYGAAYQAIKAADPSAQVVGPSIPALLVDSAGQPDTPGYELSLTDFLDWEMRSGDRFAAISWHEDGTTVQASPASRVPGLAHLPLPGGYRDYWSPAAIATHIRQAKALLAQYPALSGTQVFVNEYGPTYGVNIPGWMVGDFQALETAGADEGMITCATGDGCNSLLDGLIGFDGSPQMPYWVMKAYSQMTGSRVDTSASGANLYVLATRDDSARTIEALIGRADDCFGGVQCPQFHAASAAPVKLTLSVTIPWALKAVNVSVQAFRNTAVHSIGENDINTAPASTVIRGVAVQNGAASFSIPSTFDGDALYLTVTSGTYSSPGKTPSAPPPGAQAAPGGSGGFGQDYVHFKGRADRARRHHKHRRHHRHHPRRPHHQRHRHHQQHLIGWTG
jgi:hypothetical protein